MKKKLFIVVVVALFIITPVALIANSTKNKNVDCAVGEFGNFSVCSNTCGGGTQTRSRPVITPKSGNGKECPPLSESRPCNTQVCPLDCKVSPYSDFNDCSLTCGGGTKTRTRDIIQNPTGTGLACPVLSETEPCNTQPCVEGDCKVSPYSDFSSCSLNCGGGTKTRIRTVLVPQSGTGRACPVLSETQPCNTQPCVAGDCKVSAYSAFSRCTEGCGGGTRTRTRTVEVPQSGTGQPCPELSETEACNTQPCPVFNQRF